MKIFEREGDLIRGISPLESKPAALTYEDYRLESMIPAIGVEAVYRDTEGPEVTAPVVAWGDVTVQERDVHRRPVGKARRLVVPLMIDWEGKSTLGYLVACQEMKDFIRVQPTPTLPTPEPERTT